MCIATIAFQLENQPRRELLDEISENHSVPKRYHLACYYVTPHHNMLDHFEPPRRPKKVIRRVTGALITLGVVQSGRFNMRNKFAAGTMQVGR
jgi:hypothetical protein